MTLCSSFAPYHPEELGFRKSDVLVSGSTFDGSVWLATEDVLSSGWREEGSVNALALSLIGLSCFAQAAVYAPRIVHCSAFGGMAARESETLRRLPTCEFHLTEEPLFEGNRADGGIRHEITYRELEKQAKGFFRGNNWNDDLCDRVLCEFLLAIKGSVTYALHFFANAYEVQLAASFLGFGESSLVPNPDAATLLRQAASGRLEGGFAQQTERYSLIRVPALMDLAMSKAQTSTDLFEEIVSFREMSEAKSFRRALEILLLWPTESEVSSQMKLVQDCARALGEKLSAKGEESLLIVRWGSGKGSLLCDLSRFHIAGKELPELISTLFPVDGADVAVQMRNYLNKSY